MEIFETEKTRLSVCFRRGKKAFRYLFATLHLRWLQRIFNQNTYNYQTNT